MKIKTYIFAAALIIETLLCGCKSTNIKKNIEQPIDYSDEEIVSIEIKKINDFMSKEPVRALWRSILLGREEVIENTINNVVNQFEQALSNNDYFLAKKYYKSLISAGWKSEKYSDAQIESLYSKDVPGLAKTNAKAPKNISECMEGTVTVWLDRGLKLKNGSGYADIVIGSGFFIDPRGYIVTNHHVIESMVDPKYEGYSRLYIKLLEDQDTKIPAKVIGYDSLLDLALIKTEIEPKYVFNLGSSSDLHIGDKISVIGTPVGLEGTLTSGIISSTDRKLLSIGNVFQLDAAVNSGNSGGPLIDENMKVQAIVFAGILQFQGLNFAIPVEYLKQELNSLYCNEEVIHPWIGAFGHTKRIGQKKIGLEIQYLLPGGSAKLSGFEVGDVITEIDGKKISTIEDFQFLLMAYEYETLLKCKYQNADGENKEGYIYLEARPKDPSFVVYQSDFPNEAFVPFFGMRLVNSSTLSRNSYTIQEVIKGSTVDELNFSINDPIVVKDMKIDKENEYLFVQIAAKRKKKGFFDIILVLNTPFDNPYYF